MRRGLQYKSSKPLSQSLSPHTPIKPLCCHRTVSVEIVKIIFLILVLVLPQTRRPDPILLKKETCMAIRIPAEWEPHSCCWMAWAVSAEWSGYIRQVEDELAVVIRTISQFEVGTSTYTARPIVDCCARFSGGNVEIIEAPVDDIWLRDIAPIFALDDDEPIAIDAPSPLFAVGFAVFILGEPLHYAQIGGVLVTVIGVVTLSVTRGREGIARWRSWALLLPLAAAAVRGFIQPSIKVGLAIWPSPFAAVLTSYIISSLIIVGANRLQSGRFFAIAPLPGHLWFVLIGVLNGLAVLLLYAALANGPVALVRRWSPPIRW